LTADRLIEVITATFLFNKSTWTSVILLLPSIKTVVLGITVGKVNSFEESPPESFGKVTTILSEFAEIAAPKVNLMSILTNSPTIFGVNVTSRTFAADVIE